MPSRCVDKQTSKPSRMVARSKLLRVALPSLIRISRWQSRSDDGIVIGTEAKRAALRASRARLAGNRKHVGMSVARGVARGPKSVTRTK